MIIDHNDYELYGLENLSKCDSGPAVWLFPDIKRTVYFHQRDRKSGGESKTVRGGMDDRMGDGKSTVLLSPSCFSWALQAAAGIVDQSPLLL